ncbi:MAG: DUF4440 domain-containing protein [Flavobacteriaceae bacterium]|nr:DUF4440 domain-containing protein [Bacteroidia bacterium]NNF73687.1 DUF4440 domain-containing protein [Flavobacteriaceae bacterium]NNK71755.1 DUF4440 domain-containing protein [Flavobacteriaceae bacterium]
MKLKLVLLTLIYLLVASCLRDNSTNDIDEIKAVMTMQQEAWSNYNIAGFMDGYWKSDSLKFYGSNGITYGWQNTLDNYKKRYPSAEHTGTLTFTLDAITAIETDSYYVMGQYDLKRSVGDAHGEFLIIFRKINGSWKIIADLSC